MVSLLRAINKKFNISKASYNLWSRAMNKYNGLANFPNVGRRTLFLYFETMKVNYVMLK
jgi:hypothetical protein